MNRKENYIPFERLANHEHYYHTHSDFFNHSSDMAHAFLMENYSIGMHEQEFYEINVVTGGEGLHYINNNRVDASVGDVFIIPPRISHGYVGAEGFDVFHVILSDEFMNKYIADLQQLPSFYTLFGAEPLMRGKTTNSLHLKLMHDDFVDTLNILKDFSRHEKYDDQIDGMLRNNFAMICIGLLCNAYTEGSQSVDHLLSEDHALMKSISYIHERYFEKITIDDLTRIAHISRSTYIEKFKEICKMTPSAYLTKIRIESAAGMLLNTNLSIFEIAYRTGFYDASHFTKIFTQTYNLSPVKYRNEKNRKSQNSLS